MVFVMIGKTTRSWGQSKSWSSAIKRKILLFEKQHPGQIGLYIKDLSSGEVYSHRGDEVWYLASGIKIPVAIETLRQVGQKKLSLDEEIPLAAEDLIDGGGFTNQKKIGSTLSIRYLMEQMIVHSDNTASDLLIRKIGLDSVNHLVRETVPQGFHPITTLADVRRLAYSEAHPKAMKLVSKDLLSLKQASSEKKRWLRLKSILQVPENELQCRSIDEAFDRYYAKHYNSAKLSSYALLLEKVLTGEVLDSEGSTYLTDIMSQVETGQNRIKAGLGKGFNYAHKTGTQHRRICDFGVIWEKGQPARQGLLVAACVRDFKRTSQAENLLAQIGSTLRKAIMTDPILAQK
jgi:beta-lactamase class A